MWNFQHIETKIEVYFTSFYPFATKKTRKNVGALMKIDKYVWHNLWSDWAEFHQSIKRNINCHNLRICLPCNIYSFISLNLSYFGPSHILLESIENISLERKSKDKEKALSCRDCSFAFSPVGYLNLAPLLNLIINHVFRICQIWWF